MTDEPSLKTKADVLDLIISFIIDHEKWMDQIVERLERITDKLPSNSNRIDNVPTPQNRAIPQPDVFSLIINNPKDFDKINSIRIDWETAEKEFIPASSVDTIMNKVERSLRED